MAGIYLHIPFCKTRCVYCDFYSTTGASGMRPFVASLARELELRRSFLGGEAVATVYFGGGTPSLLSPHDISSLLGAVRGNFETCPEMEITLEANPDDISEAYAAGLAEAGVNRVSLGVQTFDGGRLKLLGRRHGPLQAARSVALLRGHGFRNISIDLIYGLPGCTLQEWEDDIAAAVSLGTEHISSYHLTYEKGTRLHEMLLRGDVCEVDEEQSAMQFQSLARILGEAGYVHYEVSNFCKPGMHSRHNTSYWLGNKYLGCGPSAHSYDGVTRQWNVSDLSSYMAALGSGKPCHESEILDLPTRYNEFAMLSLRTMWGADLRVLEEKFGKSFLEYFMENASRHIASGLMAVDGNTARLTRKGMFLSDGIISDLMHVG